MKIYFVIILLVVPTLWINAQLLTIEQAVYKLFEKPKKIKWLKKYKGKIDDFTDVAVVLGYDGKYVKGQMVYLRSDEQFNLIGIFQKDFIYLNEIDRGEAISAFMFGKIKEKSITFEWNNVDDSVGSEIYLEEVKTLPSFPSHCGVDKWLRSYRGQIAGEEVELILQKDNKTELRGQVYFVADNKSYELFGILDAKNDFLIDLKTNFSAKEGIFKGTINQLNEIPLTYITNTGGKYKSVLHLKESFGMECIEYADYISNYDLLYPKFSNAKLNQALNFRIEEWLENCRSHVKVLNNRNEVVVPSLRASSRAYAWSDVTYVSKDIVSVFMHFSSTWKEQSEGFAFNYDIDKGEEIKVDDLFKKNVDIENIIRKYLNNQVDKKQLYKTYNFRKWLAKEAFPYFTINKEGITFCTNFNMMYGQQEVTIPYAELKSYLKRNNPIAHFYK